MKSLAKQKVTVFGKQVSVVVLALVAMAGMASAGLLSFYGMITGTAIVAQSVKLDGMSCNEGCSDTDVTSGVAGSQIGGDDHALTNANPDVHAVVSLDSTPTSCPNEDCEGLTITPKFKLEPDYPSYQGANDDEDSLILVPTSDITYADFSEVYFEYYIVEEGLAQSPHVNVWFSDGTYRCLLGKGKESASTGRWLDYTAAKGDLAEWVCLDRDGNLAEVDVGDTWKLTHAAIEVGDPTEDNVEGDMQTVWVKNPMINDAEQYFGIPNAFFGNYPAKTVEFHMGYEFAINAYPGDYTIETQVTPHGTYDHWGVYFP